MAEEDQIEESQTEEMFGCRPPNGRETPCENSVFRTRPTRK